MTDLQVINGWCIRRIGGSMDFITHCAEKSGQRFEFTSGFAALCFARNTTGLA